MIFVGDIASPRPETSKQLQSFLDENSWLFSGKRIICNFEGLLSECQIKQDEPVLYNHLSVIEMLKKRGEVFAGLANNHILDLPENFDKTKKIFNEYRIDFAGAGKSKDEAENPLILYEADIEFAIFNACWDFLLYNHKNPGKGIYIAEINEEKLLDAVYRIRCRKPEAEIIIFLHWNFDLEIIPFPMHRQFAKSMIDKGADLIVGTHSHCVQGGEKYKNGYIVYGLGNFFIPHGEFANGKLSFPPFAGIELALEWDTKMRRAVCHWYEYTCKEGFHKLNYLQSSDFETCDRLKSYSVYRGMSETTYIHFFRKNRRKKFLIPVFINFKHKAINRIFTRWLKMRAKFIRFLAKMNFHKWQN